MNLRDLAAADHRSIVEDVDGGFGRELTFTNPDGRRATVKGLWNDISQTFDPQTGTIVSGRTAFVRVTRGALSQAKLGPVTAIDDGRTPWLVSFVDMRGKKRCFKVVEVHPDRSIDAIDCYLADFQP